MPGDAATTFEAGLVPNGVYWYAGQEFLIHVVQSGPLAGKRVVKYRGDTGRYKGFAFLATDYTLRFWRSFDSTYDVVDHYLVERCINQMAQRNITPSDYEPGNPLLRFVFTGNNIEWKPRCTICNNEISLSNAVDPGSRTNIYYPTPYCNQHFPQRTVRSSANRNNDYTHATHDGSRISGLSVREAALRVGPGYNPRQMQEIITRLNIGPNFIFDEACACHNCARVREIIASDAGRVREHRPINAAEHGSFCNCDDCSRPFQLLSPEQEEEPASSTPAAPQLPRCPITGEVQ